MFYVVVSDMFWFLGVFQGVVLVLIQGLIVLPSATLNSGAQSVLLPRPPQGLGPQLAVALPSLTTVLFLMGWLITFSCLQ